VAVHNKSRAPGELVEELDSVFERAAHWVGQRPLVAVAAIGGVLLVGALAGGWAALRERSSHAAEAEIAGAWDAYLAAMGASPGARDVPEPANPEVGRQARAEFAAKLLAAAQNHDDSAAAALGRLQAADLLEQNGDAEGAFAARELAAQAAPRRSAVRAIALSRYAVALETKGDLEAAAEAFAGAGEIDTPGQVLALADAARCYAQLGQRERALELYARAEKLNAAAIPAHVKQRLTELRAAAPAAAEAK
jgi:tetratricopeptide (TPR) repeat protein